MLLELSSLGLIASLLVSTSAFATTPSNGCADGPGAGEIRFRASSKFKVRHRSTADHLALSSKQASCVLEPITAADQKPATVASFVKSLSPGKKLYLVFKDFRTNIQPGVIYTAYLNLPENAPSERVRKHAVGTVNFFNATVAQDPTQPTKSDPLSASISLNSPRISAQTAGSRKRPW